MTKKQSTGCDDDEDNRDMDLTKYSNDNDMFDRLDMDDDDILSDEDTDDTDENFYEKKPSMHECIDDDNIEEVEKTRKRRTNAKPKLIGKHSLSYDTIFKGKQYVAPEDAVYESEHFIKNAGGSLDINDSDIDGEESRCNIDTYRDQRLKHDINAHLKQNTDVSFTANRRKPAKSDFNAYYSMLLKELVVCGYSRTEIFVELSGYFSDNIWNMFQLLEKQYSNIVIKELKEKYGLSDMNKIDFLD